MKRRIIALTGSIGSGKSSVAAIVKEKGFAVVDCDELSAELAADSSIWAKVAELLGADCVTNQGLNRSIIREKIFCDNDLYVRYSRIFWERMPMLLNERIAAIGDVVFVEIPVLHAFPFDWTEVWLVESSAQAQVERVKARDGVGEQNVLDILSKQAPIDIYTRKICNNGSFDDLKKAVEKAMSEAKII